MTPRAPRRFRLRNLLRRGRAEVRRSLQARTVAVVVLVALVVAVVFSAVSMVSARNSLLNQVSTQSRNDFTNQILRAQDSLNSADVSPNAQYQRLVNDVASTMQSEGASNLIGVYMWSRSTSSNAIIPVSTEPTYTALVSDEMRSGVTNDTEGNVLYQPVEFDQGTTTYPGAVLGTTLQFGNVGNLEVYALYSYESEQKSLTQIQRNLLIVCVLLSVMMGLLVWWVMRGIIRPVEYVAVAAETLASGDLNARVAENRNDEIGTLQRSFNAMADTITQKIDELEEAGAGQRRFVSDVSHELRTPVTTMRMASDLLESRRDEYDPTTKRTVELLSGQIGRFQDMLADLLEISRYDAGYAALDLVETDVRELIENAVDQVSGIAAAKRVPIHVDVPHVQVLARVDGRRVIRIIRNLLSNAVDFAMDNPVEVRLAANRKAAVISVRDHGVGMSAEQLEHVFDRFWRADPARARTTGGSGLGLSIAMADVRLHQGDIRVRSEMDEGTWFLVVLPRDPDGGAVADGDLPVRFVDDPRRMRIEGGFGLADNRMSDYRVRGDDHDE